MDTENKKFPSYMKVIDIEEVEDELNREFDMNIEIVQIAMKAIKSCIIDDVDYELKIGQESKRISERKLWGDDE